MSLTFHAIKSLSDRTYDDWLNLFQTSFPLREQVLVSELNGIVRSWEAGVGDQGHMVAVLDGERVVGMTLFEPRAASEAGALWYIAVLPELRSKGIGGEIYGFVRRAVRDVHPAARALLFEVEDPLRAHSPEEAALAERRIAFYRKQGARLLNGIQYVQSVGWQEPLPMRLMIHPYAEMEPADAYALASEMFGDALAAVEAVSFD